MNPGRGRHKALACALAALALTLGAAACGTEEETELVDGKEVAFVVEGEPIELGDLRFNVQITRFLNPNDTEDSEYLEGLPDPPPGMDYLAVFMEVENEGDAELKLPSAEEMEIKDTTGAVYAPIETESLFALDLGGTIAAGDTAPATDTAAASGPVKGAFALFLVDQAVNENRPLELEILADGEEGVIELDI
jgi:hypothetical protein